MKQSENMEGEAERRYIHHQRPMYLRPFRCSTWAEDSSSRRTSGSGRYRQGDQDPARPNGSNEEPLYYEHAR